jgi:hypothetical protein
MSQKLCAKTYTLRPALLRLSLLGTLVLTAVVFGNTGCEDKAIGRHCDVLTTASATQGVYNSQALECPSRICLKPVVDQGASTDTEAFCSAPCSQDSDCDGQTREKGNANDKRCTQGFVCGIPFVRGPLCCQKLCLCRDFLLRGATSTPTACLPGAEACN